MLFNKVGELKKQEIHLWVANRNIYNNQKSYSEYFLNDYEKNRAQRFRFKKDHDMFVIGRYTARILLAYYTQRVPEDVMILPDPFGKPTSDLDLYFNISHSNDQLLLGFSNSEIGVDIEKTNLSISAEWFSKNNFSETEFQVLEKTPLSERIDTFFEIWTKKESLVKAIGKGLSLSLKDFDVADPNGKIYWMPGAKNKYSDWYVRKIESIQGYKSAFATQNPTAKLSYFSLNS